MDTLKEWSEAKSNDFTNKWSHEQIRNAIIKIENIVKELNSLHRDGDSSSLQDRLCDFLSQASSCWSINNRGEKFRYSSEAIHTIRFASTIADLYEKGKQIGRNSIEIY